MFSALLQQIVLHASVCSAINLQKLLKETQKKQNPNISTHQNPRPLAGVSEDYSCIYEEINCSLTSPSKQRLRFSVCSTHRQHWLWMSVYHPSSSDFEVFVVTLQTGATTTSWNIKHLPEKLEHESRCDSWIECILTFLNINTQLCLPITRYVDIDVP